MQSLKILLVSSLVIIFTTINQAYANCNLPAVINTYDYDYTKHKRERQNLIKTDYLMLALSYSPKFCNGNAKRQKTHPHQCKNNDFGLIVHGLWPQSLVATDYKQHPRNCVNTPAINTNTLKQYLCLIPGVKLIQSEWEKHGSCHYKNAVDYLTKTKQLFKQLILPKWSKNNPPPKTPKQVNKILKHFNPKLLTKDIIVKFKGRDLNEIRICYDLEYQYTSCYK